MLITLSFCSKEKFTQAMLEGVGAYISRFSERPYERYDFYDTAQFDLSKEGAVLYAHTAKLSYQDAETCCGASLKNPDKPVCLADLGASPLKKLLAQKLKVEPLGHIATAAFRVSAFSVVEDNKAYTIRVLQRQSANSRSYWFYTFESENAEAMRLLNERLLANSFVPCSFYAYLLTFAAGAQAELQSDTADAVPTDASASENSFFKYILRQAETALSGFSDTGDMDSLLAGSACLNALLLPKPSIYTAKKTADFAVELWDAVLMLSGLSLLENAGAEGSLLDDISAKRDIYAAKLIELKFPTEEEIYLPSNAAGLLGKRLEKIRRKLKKSFKNARKKRSIKSFANLCPAVLNAVCNLSFINGKPINFGIWNTLFTMMLAGGQKKCFKAHKKTIKALIPLPAAEELDAVLTNTHKLLDELKSCLD